MEHEPDAAHADDALDAVIVGAGLTGMTLGHLLARRRPDWRVAVLERAERPGGPAGSIRAEGFTTDLGPNGFLGGAEATEALLDDLGLQPAPAAPAAQRRYLYRDGGLRPLPDGPGSFLASELLHPGAKARALLEPWLAAPHPGDEDESVHAFLARHFGRAAADAVAEPLVLGIYGGDPRELALSATFPRLRALEAEHGSLLRGMVRGQRQRLAAARRGEAPARPDRRLRSFGSEGMQPLVDALAASLGPRLCTGAEVRALEPRGDAWTVRLADGRTRRAKRVAVTAPAHAAAPLLRDVDAHAAAALGGVPHADVRVFGLGYARADVPHALDGFGYLVPSGQGARVLGVLWSSTLYPGQAPGGYVHLRVLAGGRRDPELVRLGADEAWDVVRRDLHRTLGVAADPVHAQDLRWPRAIPQYVRGHGGRVRAAEAAERRRPGLALAGTAYRGVGVNDAIREGTRVADRWAPT